MHIDRQSCQHLRGHSVSHGVNTATVEAACNGMEHGDLDRPENERNSMWRRLAEQHAAAPFNLLLHGGDQVYSDEMPDAHPASRGWPRRSPDHLGSSSVAELGCVLRDAWFRRYVHVFGQPEFAWLAARVPALAMWDDHDISDGWGSYPDPVLDSDVGRCIFSAARESFILFQLGAAPGELPGFCLDRTGQSLTWSVHLPGLQRAMKRHQVVDVSGSVDPRLRPMPKDVREHSVTNGSTYFLIRASRVCGYACALAPPLDCIALMSFSNTCS